MRRSWRSARGWRSWWSVVAVDTVIVPTSRTEQLNNDWTSFIQSVWSHDTRLTWWSFFGEDLKVILWNFCGKLHLTPTVRLLWWQFVLDSVLVWLTIYTGTMEELHYFMGKTQHDVVIFQFFHYKSLLKITLNNYLIVWWKKVSHLPRSDKMTI